MDQSKQSPQPSEQTSSSDAQKIHLTVRNRTMILFNDDVKSVTSRNDTGVFDILPEHSNFISLISTPLIIGRLDGQKREIAFGNGIIKVKDNAVHCYVDLLSKEATINPQNTNKV